MFVEKEINQVEPDNQAIVSEGFIERFERRYPTHILQTLLCDRTTGRNIIWADNEYEALGDGYMGDDEITIEKITGLNSGIIKPRIAKEQERQSLRTKSRAEVFTPSWLCNQMNNDLDEVWFERRDVFNCEEEQSWTANQTAIEFPSKRGHGWHAYVESPRLEITCGEAPFICSRYDTVTGIALPVNERIGLLDRKLRVVTEKTKTRNEWVRRALDALKACYGFEYQGDNLVVARINVFETFYEHLSHRWGLGISEKEMAEVAWIISWNFWQMNGFTDAVPTNKMDAEVESTLGSFEEPEPEPAQLSLFDLFDDAFADETPDENTEEKTKDTVPLCVIYSWQRNEPFEFASLKGKECPMGKKFYAVIGNPPYQGENDSNGRQPPIYHYFMDEAYKISNRVELITPARFLFNAGQTPKSWNNKMLSDNHLTVLRYESDAAKVFPDTEIKGGVAVTLRDASRDYGEIGIFTKYPELNSILKKIQQANGCSLSEICVGAVPYRFTDCLRSEHPECVALAGDSFDLRTNALENLSGKVFFEDREKQAEMTGIYGVLNRNRVCMWIDSRYVSGPENFNYYKLLISKASGSGQFGETLPAAILSEPGTGHTQSFISIGSFGTKEEARNLERYIKGKFSRSLLGVLKVTQDITPTKWKYVPLQDFTSSSDIDWTQSISDIDKQLYAKYGLSDEEIEFIETHVKEMN